MDFFIYRDYLGKKYPGILLREVIAFLITLLSFILLNGKISPSDFDSKMWSRLIFIATVQEWIFFIHLSNSSIFYDIFKVWKYVVIQVVFAVLLPSLLAIYFKSALYQGSNISVVHEPMTRMEMGLFYPHVILVLNLLYFGCLIAPTQYTEKLTLSDENTEEELFLSHVEIIKVKGENVIISADGRRYSVLMTPKLKSALRNIDPRIFKTLDKRLFINKVLLQGLDKRNLKSFIDELDGAF